MADRVQEPEAGCQTHVSDTHRETQATPCGKKRQVSNRHRANLTCGRERRLDGRPADNLEISEQ